MECDVVVYDLHSADLKEVEEKLMIFKTAKIEEAKTIVIVSSVMGWVNTPVKIQIENAPIVEAEVTEEVAEKAPESEESLKKAEEPAEGKIVNTPVPFEETDFQLRVPHNDYLAWKNIEDLAMGLAAKENLNVYIISAGVLYGNGEKIFEHHFKSAWLESPRSLPYLGEGENLIPTIHVKDLAKIVKFLVDSKPETKYLFGIDNTKDRKQISIVKAISDGIGTGLVESVKSSGMDWEEFLSINVWMKPSSILVPEEEVPPPFEWHSLDGVSGNIYKLNNEFNSHRGLRPIKVFVSGPPASGKTHFSKKISEEYNIPHLKVKDLIVECALHKSELGETLKKLAEANQRVPDSTLAEVFRWKLHMNHCRNRGFILDGYPRSYKEASNLFVKEKKPEIEIPEEAEEPKAKEYELDTEILPKSVIVFRASTSFLMNRISSLSHQQSEFNQERMERRLRVYHEDNIIAPKSVFDYFTELDTEVFQCECTDEEIEIIEGLRIYIEREGRPYNFLASIQEMVENRRRFMQQRDVDIVEKNELKRKEEEEVKRQELEKRDGIAQKRFENVRKQLEDASRDRSTPLRKYLMENVMPTLAEALIQVCKIMPEDPVDYVAELVYAASKKKP